jgi:SpoIID/LytB domain protein
LGNDGIPLKFSFVGAGVGNGVGMCQTGAVALGFQGKSYREILNHYFHYMKIKKIY